MCVGKSKQTEIEKNPRRREESRRVAVRGSVNGETHNRRLMPSRFRLSPHLSQEGQIESLFLDPHGYNYFTVTIFNPPYVKKRLRLEGREREFLSFSIVSKRLNSKISFPLPFFPYVLSVDRGRNAAVSDRAVLVGYCFSIEMSRLYTKLRTAGCQPNRSVTLRDYR